MIKFGLFGLSVFSIFYGFINFDSSSAVVGIEIALLVLLILILIKELLFYIPLFIAFRQEDKNTLTTFCLIFYQPAIILIGIGLVISFLFKEPKGFLIGIEGVVIILLMIISSVTGTMGKSKEIY